MTGPRRAATSRAGAGWLGDRLLRGLLALGAMTTGVAAPGWWRERGEHWWQGAAPARRTGPRPAGGGAGGGPGALDDPRLLRRLRSLRGSQDLARLTEAARGHADAAPHWHPERRSAGGG